MTAHYNGSKEHDFICSEPVCVYEGKSTACTASNIYTATVTYFNLDEYPRIPSTAICDNVIRGPKLQLTGHSKVIGLTRPYSHARRLYIAYI